MELFLKADTWLALLTLCFLEIVLGIDNIIFISIVSNKLPEEQRTKARNLGLFMAMFVRIALLLTITWIIQFTQPLFTVPANFLFGEAKSFSGKDLILGFGGLFLIAKSTMEINHGMESDDEDGHGQKKKKVVVTLAGTIVQIILLDIVFSFDSILTAIGIVDPDKVIIMIIAVVVSIIVMMFFSGHISRFIQQHPSMEVLALGFLILIGFMLFLEALEFKVPKGYIYFAVAFSLLIELTNIRVKKNRKTNPIKLNKKAYNKSESEKNPKPSLSKEEEDLKYPIGKFSPKDSYTAEEVALCIERIELLPAKLESAVKNLGEQQLDTPYRDGGWSVRQVVHHVSDSHLNAYVRVKWTLTENEPTIKAYDEKAWAKTPETKLSPTLSLEVLKDLHKKWVALLNGLSPEDREKTFIHPDTSKQVRIDRTIAMYAWHGEHHLAQITSLKERKGWT
jgi:predicted tellurium resistance membrane protein TerC/uncharacterized damage-inducible protein DinB